MENNNGLDFTLKANDVCTPAALYAYADSAESHGALDVADNVRKQAVAITSQQTQQGAVIPNINAAACSDAVDNTAGADQQQQPGADAEQQPNAQNNDATTGQQQQPAAAQQQTPDANQQQPPAQDQQNSNAGEQAPPPQAEQTTFALSDYAVMIDDNKITVVKKTA